MSTMTDHLGINEDRALKIGRDVEDILRCGQPRMVDIGSDLKTLATTYSGQELVFAGYVYGRRIQHNVHLANALGMKIEIIEVKNP